MAKIKDCSESPCVLDDEFWRLLQIYRLRLRLIRQLRPNAAGETCESKPPKEEQRAPLALGWVTRRDPLEYEAAISERKNPAARAGLP
ncbi:MAG: hypothetical protein WA733_01285 [Methylocystis sp.]